LADSPQRGHPRFRRGVRHSVIGSSNFMWGAANVGRRARLSKPGRPVLTAGCVVAPIGALSFSSGRCFDGRSLVFLVGTMFWRSPVLFFPSGRCSGGHRSYFSRRDDVLAVTGLIFPVGTMF
jgi:hypothetical protein